MWFLGTKLIVYSTGICNQEEAVYDLQTLKIYIASLDMEMCHWNAIISLTKRSILFSNIKPFAYPIIVSPNKISSSS